MKKLMQFVLALCATLAAQAAAPCFTVKLRVDLSGVATNEALYEVGCVNKAAFSSPARVDALPQMPESRRIARPRSKRAGCCEKGADLLQYGQPE